MKKIIFVGASIPNLYGARELKNKGYDVVVYERDKHHQNPQRRRLPISFLKELGYNVNSNEEHTYIELTQIKDFLAQGLIVRYSSPLKINLVRDKVFDDEELLQFDYLILNTAHDKIVTNSKRILSYDYSLGVVDNHFAGNSLISAIKKVDEIIDKIIVQ